MDQMDDSALLREYCENGSSEAFAVLVRRHIDLVYSVAVRQVTNRHQAEEIVHAVFIIFANKAGQLRQDRALSSWLFRTTQLTARNFVRSEMRRHRREQEAYMQSLSNEPDEALWTRIAPLLDTAVAALNETDRRAVLLRFYEGKSFQEVGSALDLTEGAVKKRVGRAVDKLQQFFFKRGITSATDAMEATLTARSVESAPPALAVTAITLALTKSAAVPASTSALAKGTLKFMAISKAKITVVSGLILLLAAGTAAVAVKKMTMYDDSWRVPKFDNMPVDGPRLLAKTAPQVRIVPSKYSHQVGGLTEGDAEFLVNGKIVVQTNQSQTIGIGSTADGIVRTAYDADDLHTIFATSLPTGRYDFIANLPHGSMPALQAEIKKKLHLVGEWMLVETNVFVLRSTDASAQKLKPAGQLAQTMDITNIDQLEKFHGASRDDDHFYYTVDIMIKWLGFESEFSSPIVDETGITNRFDFSFTFPVFRDNNEAAHRKILQKAIQDQLGLELVPATRPVKMLVVRKTD